MPTIKDKLTALIKHYGSQAALGRALGHATNRNMVGWWMKDQQAPSRMSCEAIERLYDALPGKEG